MARKVFYSFHYAPDSSRAAQVRNMGVVEGNPAASDNDWETVKRGGDAAIERWIDAQLNGKSCAIVLIGSATAGRKWINHEIVKAWNGGKGVVGVYIHGLKDLDQRQTTQGANPFSSITFGTTTLASVVKAYNPPYVDSKQVYNYISDNLANWFEEAITIRGKY